MKLKNNNMEQKITRNSEQSKEFTDALNFVLNYRENMEGMHGFIPSSDLAEMIVVYNQSRPQVDILANKKSIREMLEEYTILLGMEENTFDWNIDILSEMFYVEKINSKGQAGESVDEKIFKEASDYAERVCNGEFPIEYTKEQVVKHTKNDFISGAKWVISTFQKDNEDQLFRTAL